MREGPPSPLLLGDSGVAHKDTRESSLQAQESKKFSELCPNGHLLSSNLYLENSQASGKLEEEHTEHQYIIHLDSLPFSFKNKPPGVPGWLSQ